MKRIIVNGANGFVASNFINDLLKNDYEVVALVRGNGKLSARERVEQSLMQVNRGQLPDIENLSVYNYSLLEKDYALPQTHLNKIFEKEADFFHFAASLKYDQKSKEEIYSTNVEGVDNSVRVFKQYAQGASRFFLVGTAYSCGHINEVFEERFYPDMDVSAFRNYYEWSKRLSENVVQRHMSSDPKFRGHIIRLSQVAGNNETGETFTDYGIFDFAKRVHRLAKRYPGQTIRARIAPEATQNLIPVNTVVDYLMQTIKREEVPVIMNFVAKEPVKNKYVINSLNSKLPITIVPHPGLKHSDMNALERLMAVGMSFTGSYSNLDIRFDTSRRDEVIVQGKDNMDEAIVHKMLAWFIDNVCEKSGKKEAVVVGKH
ncbi:SDR family oxidoreductase [Thermophagus xiamenensis]|uniref:Nucleoside-diphosphate-sugar epimerase n=1 Tax=Thermophagus xiamenensis TaxID=385682 RepID=A0A1I2DK50_9BACT|nr:SDR family oxidoreductase [Thermophagus xiamenensis]SFE80818.1 Nucleoside-diphosphate-sugar epimerase [Thermophagus xiamenensis]